MDTITRPLGYQVPVPASVVGGWDDLTREQADLLLEALEEETLVYGSPRR